MGYILLLTACAPDKYLHLKGLEPHIPVPHGEQRCHPAARQDQPDKPNICSATPSPPRPLPCQCTAGQAQRAAPLLLPSPSMTDARALQKVVPSSPAQESQGSAPGEVNEPKRELPGIFSWQQGQADSPSSSLLPLLHQQVRFQLLAEPKVSFHSL